MARGEAHHDLRQWAYARSARDQVAASLFVGPLDLAWAIASPINNSASSLSPQWSILTHLPGSRSL